MPLVWAFGPPARRQSPEPGAEPSINSTTTAGRSPASHPAAEPVVSVDLDNVLHSLTSSGGAGSQRRPSRTFYTASLKLSRRPVAPTSFPVLKVKSTRPTLIPLLPT